MKMDNPVDASKMSCKFRKRQVCSRWNSIDGRTTSRGNSARMIEQTTQSTFLHDEEYTRKVIAFIKTEFFEDLADRYIFDVIKDYIDEYNSLPTKQALKIPFDS